MDETAREMGPARLDRGVLADGVGPRVRLLRNILASRVTAALDPFGLRSGALTTMALIAANDGCTQAELARDMGMDKSSVVALVDELEKRGLAERSRSTHDRRRNMLSLTAAGARMMAAMHAAAAAQEEAIRQAFSPDEFDRFLAFLDRAYEAVAADEQG
jgi:DNA-binding MarR family transcriptional regulator